MTQSIQPESAVVRRAPRILLADDDPIILRAISRLLSSVRPTWRVECVSNGALALERLRAEHFDVLITDIEMPMVDGIQLLEELLRSQSEIVRVVHASRSDTPGASLLLGLADHIIDKSATTEVLLATLDAAVASLEQPSSTNNGTAEQAGRKA